VKPSSAEVKNGWSYTSTPPVCLNGVDRANFAHFLIEINMKYLQHFA